MSNYEEEKKIDVVLWCGVSIVAPLIPLAIASMTKLILEDRLSIPWIVSNILLFVFSFSINFLSLLYDSIRLKRSAKKFGYAILTLSLAIAAMSISTLFDSGQVKDEASLIVLVIVVIFLVFFAIEHRLSVFIRKELFDISHSEGKENA